MATYVIGDLQGCFDAFQALLEHLQFDQQHDQLWLTGDLVNRGPASLAVLRFLRALPKPPVIVLGNHDLHFLAMVEGLAPHKGNDTLDELLQAPDVLVLSYWLRNQPLLHHDTQLNVTMVHAGLAPQWNLAKAQQCANEVETVLRSEDYRAYLQQMYGNTPDSWSDTLVGWDRLRVITNYFTRLRFCTVEGKIDLVNKGAIGTQAPDYFPWFEVPGRAHADLPIVFGHWAALCGQTQNPIVSALDTGCVWGQQLTAMRLEDNTRYSVNCR